ncbi:MAG TPA: DUF3047 domain-containing protein [Amycolatopsis sp.]|nr:DUF3047 domain-containing protein [Amycolatopsis sp.]
MLEPITTSDALRRYAGTEQREPIAPELFRDEFTKLLGKVPLVRRHVFQALPAGSPGWLDTGLAVPAGGAVTLFTTAQPDNSADTLENVGPDLAFWRRISAESEARRGVWHRIGPEDAPRRGARASATVVAPRAGTLRLATSPAVDYQPPPVDRLVLAVHWAGDPVEGLRALSVAGDVGGIVDAEIARQRAAVERPSGWHYPPLAGECEQFVADGAIIGCYSRRNGALLRRDATLPFLPGTTLHWAWRMVRLPSDRREDRLRTHDYLSIAVEFDNGRDLTYCWSAELPIETGYHCPVPGWENRETHVVVRSGSAGLGHWCDEERDVYADYTRHVGEAPSRITRVWLLASTFRQGGEGQCDYGRIELRHDVAGVRLN